MSSIASLLRLEIERAPDTGELLNLVQNPDGRLGAWWWVTPVAGSTMRSFRYTGDYYLLFTSPGGVASHFISEPMPIVPGQYAAARWLVESAVGQYAVQFEWLDAGKALLSATTASSNYGPSADPRAYGSYVAPASAAYFRLRFDHYDGTGGNPAAGDTLTFRSVVATAADTAGGLAVTRVNLMPTPSAEGGVGNWTAEGGAEIGTSTAQSWDGTHSFTLTKKDEGGPASFRSPSMTVQPGRDYALQVRSRSGDIARKVTLLARWLDAAGKILATVPVRAQTETNGLWTAPITGVATAPTNAATLRVMVRYGYMAKDEVHYLDATMAEQSGTVSGYFDGETAGALGYTFAWSGTPYASTSIASGPTGDPGVLVPVPYQNILGPTARIAVDREDLNVGSLSVRLFDAILDPTQTDLVRPGKRIRLLSVDPDASPGTEPEVLFEGKTYTASVNYRLLEENENKRAEVNISAVDPINPLASTPSREGVATIAELPYVLEGAGVPWSVNGSGNQVPTAAVVAYNDNASVLDQVAVTRDSALGYAWVDRNGVLQAWDRAELDTTVAAELDETTYTADIDIDFDLERIVNSVTVKVLRVIATSGVTEEVSFGPYVDQTSYRQWGEHSQEYVVQGLDPANAAAIQAYAQQILDANATPHQRVNTMVLPVKTAADLPKARLDLYDLVHVVNVRANVDENSRVVSIHHEITADSSGGEWLTTLGFVKDGSVASSVAVPAPPPGVGPVKEQITGGYSGSLQDVYDTADAAAQAAADAAATGTAAQTTADGKNTVTYSASAPGTTPNTAGDIWWQRSGSIIAGQWVGLGGTSWQQTTLSGLVIAYIDAGQITAGSAFVNALSVKTNFTLGDASTDGVIQSYNFAGSSVGVYLSKSGLVAKGGSIASTTITGSTFSTGGSYPITINGDTITFGSGPYIQYAGGSFTMANGAFAISLGGGVDIYGNLTLHNSITGSISASGSATFGLGGSFGGSVSLGGNALNAVGQVNNGGGTITMAATIKPNECYLTDLPVSTGGEAVYMGGSGRLYAHATPSRAEWKRDVEPLAIDAGALAELRPITFRYREDVPFDVDDPEATLYGYLYDQAEELGLDLLIDTREGLEVARPERLVYAVLDAWQQDHRRLTDLEHRVAELRALLEDR